MQDGLLQKKPFILYNIGGFFHHLLEYLKSMANKGFADPVPFIVVDKKLTDILIIAPCSRKYYCKVSK